MPSQCTLEAKHIIKSFPGVLANDDVNFCVERGSIHAVLGENGAGKSTLMRIIYGLYRPDAGEIYLDGAQVEIHNPLAAIRLGIGMVHQEFQLVPSLTVAENIALGREYLRGVFIDRGRVSARCREIADRLGLELDLSRPISELSIGYQQRVEIMKLLYRDARILILDEPTTVLTPHEVDALFSILYQLRDEGHTIVLITHKLREVKQCADTATVLRGGRVQGVVEVATAEEEELVGLMMGRSVRMARRSGEPPPGAEELLRVEGVHTRDDRGIERLRGVSFAIRAGEILGVAGVEGNGQAELVETIGGIRAHTGSLYLGGESFAGKHTRARRTSGLSIIPENRGEQGLNLHTTLAENLVSTRYFTSNFSKHGVLRLAAIEDAATMAISDYEIAATGPQVAAATLSGGNAQKVVVARELSHEPRAILAAHPTRGLDVSAAQFVRTQLLDLRRRGLAILLISADMDELFALADRIVVMLAGRIVGERRPEDTDEAEIGLLMSGARSDATTAPAEEDAR